MAFCGFCVLTCGAEPSLIAATERAEDWRCGHAVLGVAFALEGISLSDDQVRDALPLRDDGSCRLVDTKDACDAYGLRSAYIDLKRSKQPLPHCPVIAALDRGDSPSEDHFVVLYGEVDGRVQVLNYPNPPRLWKWSRLEKSWDGRGLAVASDSQKLAHLYDPVETNILVATTAAVLCIIGIWMALRCGQARTQGQ